MGIRAEYGAMGRGTVLTKAISLAPNVSRLVMNLDSGVGGEVRVAVVDAASGAELPGLDWYARCSSSCLGTCLDLFCLNLFVYRISCASGCIPVYVCHLRPASTAIGTTAVKMRPQHSQTCSSHPHETLPLCHNLFCTPNCSARPPGTTRCRSHEIHSRSLLRGLGRNRAVRWPRLQRVGGLSASFSSWKMRGSMRFILSSFYQHWHAMLQYASATCGSLTHIKRYRPFYTVLLHVLKISFPFFHFMMYLFLGRPRTKWQMCAVYACGSMAQNTHVACAYVRARVPRA